jgi:hypothetical protein
MKPETYLSKQVKPRFARLVQPLGGYVRPRLDVSNIRPDKSDKSGLKTEEK